ncbi:hypothetical protein [Butyricicoccus intestinisimiae]|jgi:hypothetical protein|uniref:hypothetical protein n=1 Tax=Butyricicoccus intestinisimiae TaxID=2841509 RepID=UPI003D9465CB
MEMLVRNSNVQKIAIFLQNILAIFAKNKKESEKSEEWRNTRERCGQKSRKTAKLGAIAQKIKKYLRKNIEWHEIC